MTENKKAYESAQRAIEYLSSERGKEEMRVSLERTRSVCDELLKAIKINPERLYVPVDL